MRTAPLLATAVFVLIASAAVLAKDKTDLKDALEDHLVTGDWLYDDIEAGYAEAKKTGKPLLISFRCVP